MSVTNGYTVGRPTSGNLDLVRKFNKLLRSMGRIMAGSSQLADQQPCNLATGELDHTNGDILRKQIAETDFTATGWAKASSALQFRQRILDGLPPAHRDF